MLGKLHDKAGNRTPRKDKEITYSHPLSAQTKKERYYTAKILSVEKGGWQSTQPARRRALGTASSPFPTANPAELSSLSPSCKIALLGWGHVLHLLLADGSQWVHSLTTAR